MNRKILNLMAAFMAAVFVISALPVFAAPSSEYASKDYRNMQIMNKQGVVINKPTSQFAAKRIVNGQIADAVVSYADYDCTVEFPTLTCYVGDTLSFEDLSHDNNAGGEIAEWDWQYYGSLGDHNELYSYNVVNSTSITVNNPGETIFYLCVKNNSKVKTGCCDPWSENGNHQIVGKNKWFPKGAYWYFSAIRVIVKPVREAVVYIRYWDAQNNKVFHEGYINAGQILNDADTVDTSFHITDWDGYAYSGWNVQLPDGTIQYSGTERDVGITLAGWLPEKYLNIEYNPYMSTGVEVRYWDSYANKILQTDLLTGEKVVREQEIQITANMVPPYGYKINGWNVQLIDGTIQYTGTDNPTDIILNGYLPTKYLNVECVPLSNTKLTVNYIDSDTGSIIDSEVIVGEEVHGSQTSTVTAELKDIPGYVMTGWILTTPDGAQEASGQKDTISVTLTEKTPHKILVVDCLKLKSDDGDSDDDNDDIPDPTITVKPAGDCDGVIEWTEKDSHRVFSGYTSSGRKKYRTCTHSFDYRSELTAEAQITPDTLKSGYGFDVNVSCAVNTKLVSNKGGCSNWGKNRKALMYINDPTKATVYIPWDMTNRLGTQNKAIAMESNGRLKFRLPISNVSEAGARKIYTPVELPGTAEEPVSHEFEIYINGGGFEGVEFCQKIIGRITINGDMYSDDFSGSD